MKMEDLAAPGTADINTAFNPSKATGCAHGLWLLAVQALQKRAAKAQGDAKQAFDARVAQIRGEYEERSRRLKGLAAEQLKRAAAQLEK